MKRKLLFLILFLLIATLVACTNPTESDVSINLKPAVDTVQINSQYTDPGAQARAFGFPVAYEVLSNSVDITALGEYEIIYQVNYKGIIKEVKRIVTVVDLISPVVTLKQGIDTVSLHSSWVDEGVNVSDNSNLDVLINVSGTVDTETVGDYVITYEVTDSSGNKTVCYRYVYVTVQTGNME